MYEIQKLSHRHRAMVNFFLAGENQKEVAERFGMTEPGMHIVYNSSLFQQLLRQRQSEIDKEVDIDLTSTVSLAGSFLREKALQAAERLVELSGSLDERVGLSAVNSLLDRCFGDGKKDNRPVVMINAEQIQNLQLVLQEVRS